MNRKQTQNRHAGQYSETDHSNKYRSSKLKLGVLVLVLVVIGVLLSAYLRHQGQLRKDAQVRALLDQSRQLQDARQYIAGTEPLRQALKLEPDNPDALLALGTLDIRINNIYQDNEAVRVMQRYTQLRPNDPNGWESLGEAMGRSGNAAGAISALNHYMTMQPGDAQTYLLLADQEAIAGCAPAAVAAHVENSISMGMRNNSYAYLLLGRAQLAMGNYRNAIDSLTQCIALDTQELDKRAPYYLRSQAERRLGMTLAAENDQNESLRLTNLRLKEMLQSYSQGQAATAHGPSAPSQGGTP